MGDISIGEAARRTGLRPSAIRYYERRDLVPRPPRRGGRRCYDPSVVTRLAIIAGSRRAGLSIREIRALLAAARSPDAFGETLIRTIADLDRRIEALDWLRLRLREAAACGCEQPLECDLVSTIEPPRAWRYRSD